MIQNAIWWLEGWFRDAGNWILNIFKKPKPLRPITEFSFEFETTKTLTTNEVRAMLNLPKPHKHHFIIDRRESSPWAVHFKCRTCWSVCVRSKDTVNPYIYLDQKLIQNDPSRTLDYAPYINFIKSINKTEFDT